MKKDKEKLNIKESILEFVLSLIIIIALKMTINTLFYGEDYFYEEDESYEDFFSNDENLDKLISKLVDLNLTDKE